MFTRSLPLLNPLGAIVAIGFAGGLWTDPSVQWLVGRNASVVGVYLGRLMKLQPELVHEAATELLALWARGEIDPVVGVDVPARRGGRRARADRVAAARRQGRARAVKALVTGGEGGLGRAMRARLEREGYEVQSLDLVDGFDVTDPAAWEQVGPVDLACLNAGILTPEIEIAELSDEGYRRAVSVNVDGVVFGVRRLAQVMDGGSIVATASLAGLVGMPLDADLLADEARRRRLRALGRAATRADPDQRDLPGHRRHADARPARSAGSASLRRGSRSCSRTTSRMRCGSQRRARGRGSAGSCSRAVHAGAVPLRERPRPAPRERRDGRPAAATDVCRRGRTVATR